MTVSSPYAPVTHYGSGSAGPFVASWPIISIDHLKITKISGTTETVLTYGGGADQYTGSLISGGLAGVTTNLGTNLLSGERIVMERVTPRTQPEDIKNQGEFSPEIHERAFDRLTMLVQESELSTGNALKFPLSDTPGLNQTLPVDVSRAGKYLYFNATTGEPEAVSADAANVAAATAAAQGYRDEAQVYRDQALAASVGLVWRPPVRAATTGALPTNTYNNGSSGVGATLTATANGAFPAQDGVTPSVGDRLLVKNEASALKNGVYTLTNAGSAGTQWVLTRATDADTWAELTSQVVKISEGTTLQDFQFTCSINAGGTIGVTAITWQNDNAVIADGTVSSAAKIVDGIITYPKLASSAVATSAEFLAKTASKLINAAVLGPFFESVKVTKSAVQNITIGTWFKVSWDVETWKHRTSMHNNSTNNTRLVADTAGLYRITAQVPTSNGGSKANAVRILKNGSYVAGLPAMNVNTAGSININGAGTWPGVITGVVDMAVNDYLEVEAQTNIASEDILAESWAIFEQIR